MERNLYGKLTHTDHYLHQSSHHQTICNESVHSFLFSRTYCIVTNKDGLNEKNTRIKQVLQENDIKKALLVKSLRELPTITACLSYNNKHKPQVSKSVRSK